MLPYLIDFPLFRDLQVCNPIASSHVLSFMGHEQDMAGIEAKLARCRELEQATRCEFTRGHLRQLASDLQTELNGLDDATRRLGYRG